MIPRNKKWITLHNLLRVFIGALREQFQAAVDEVVPEEDDHLTWALATKERLTLLQLSSSGATSLGEKAEQVLARVQNWLSD